jgi:hypothetical protein
MSESILQGENIVQIAGWIVGFVGALITLCGGLVSYIFKRHIGENDLCAENNRKDHIRIHARIDTLYAGKKK